METHHDNSPQGDTSSLPLQQEALAYGMLHDKNDNITDYKLENGIKILSHTDLGDKGFNLLVDKFRNNPKDCLAVARENLFLIMTDQNLPREKRLNRLSRYLDAYFDLQSTLDHQAFPPSEKVLRGIPTYLPDGLSDMGSDSTIESGSRKREKLRVDKDKVLAQSKDLFMSIFSNDFSQFSNLSEKEKSSAIKTAIVDQIGRYVHHHLPYDHYDQANYQRGNSIPISEFRNMKLAVCRQQALYAQILLQSFGLTSRLIKTNVSFDGRDSGPHANNLVRINYRWYVLDVTAPERLNPNHSRVFLKPVPESNIDLNESKYTWSFDNGYSNRKYVTRNNMFYKIMDNAKNPG